MDVVGLLEPLAVTTEEYDETDRRQRDLSIEMLARGLAPREES